MTGRDLLLITTVLCLSAALTGLVRRRALARGILDLPNTRSSHTIPTPRGGGLAIVVAATIGLTTLWVWGVVDSRLALALLGGGAGVALIGYLDDRGSLSVRARIVVHFACAVWAVAVLGGLPPIQWGSHAVDLGWAGVLLAVLAIVWMLNLFNFMDGIDGIAGSEAVFVSAAGAALASVGGLSGSVPAAASVVAAASVGFLCWNWPPAKIFMGDVGSGYLGYVIAVLALGATRENPAMLYVWLILGGTFFVDATVTLISRLLRGERVYEAHRSHAYQRLSRRWRSHRRVTVSVWLANVLWLLPMAMVAAANPAFAALLVLVALVPIVVAVSVAGAGRHD
ncbi:MAG TPA: glycosyltransferase family 4 protein [Polyangiaceae bacterium]|nr:glycosyltransferase family 4 protein [Polyangiaceae bacterium]